MEYAAQALIYWVVVPHHALHMHSWARITLQSIPNLVRDVAAAWLVAIPGWRCICSPGWVLMTSWLPHASQAPKRCWTQRLLGKSFNPVINECMKPNKEGTDLLRENGFMKSILHLSTTGKAVAEDSVLPQAHCSSQEGNYGAVCSKIDAPHSPEPSGPTWPCHLPV